MDLELERARGLTIVLMEDRQPNHLYYPRECSARGSILFGPFYTPLYKLKEAHPEYPLIKLLLNALSGILGQQVRTSIKAKKGDKPRDIDHLLDLDIMPDETGVTTYEGIDASTVIFKHAFARCSPFMTSFGRRDILKKIGPENEDKVVHIHTDGFIATEALPLKLGKNMGDLKYEGYSETVHVQHVNSVLDDVTGEKF